ncbi:lysosomal acid glucosylceramidase-like [Contarinia nasturtii]|uniref:lysosomal acid glucosylceramidase-like n=1 Tax=Contarinia nasturtii TaxID=265458 RepID=UPI0012D47062|nr:lysosomal acid glucosylceramidase-like [Contarinia nasturtii]
MHYFSTATGIGHNMLRIPIGCSDFYLEKWTYVMDSDNDLQLLNFTKLNERDTIRNAAIKEMQQIRGNGIDILLLGASWSPPIWMKQNHQWYCKTDNQLIPAYYQMMNYDGMNIWGISTGNEPEADNHADWLVDNLVPALKESGHSDIKIHIYDHNRDSAISC